MIAEPLLVVAVLAFGFLAYLIIWELPKL